MRHTGIRLSEALMLHEHCLRKDLMKKYLLEVVSEKNEIERFIPVNMKVVKATKHLISLTNDLRIDKGSNKLFFIYMPYKKAYGSLLQRRSRELLKTAFIKK